jgi:hypothetical protein
VLAKIDYPVEPAFDVVTIGFEVKRLERFSTNANRWVYACGERGTHDQPRLLATSDPR